MRARRHKWVRGRALCLIGAGVLAAAVAGAAPGDISELQGIYNEHLEKILTGHDANVATLSEQYATALKQAAATCRGAGNLDGLKAVQREANRFRVEGGTADIPLVSESAPLADIQTRFHALQSQHSLDRARQVVALAERYTGRLAELQKQYTTAGRIAEATALSEEITAVRASPVFTAADFEVAAHEAETQGAPAAEAEGPAPDDLPPPREEAIDRTGAPAPGWHTAGVEIYEKGRRPPREQGLHPCPLFRTDHSPLKAEVSVRMETSLDTDLTASSARQMGGVTVTRQGDAAYRARLALRTTRTQTVLNNVRVVVRYYTKPGGGRSGRLIPTSLAIHNIYLPNLDSDYVHVDCPPVVLSKSSHRFHSGWGSTSVHTGAEFYGVLITVYREDGVIACQSATSKHLAGFASAKLPSAEEMREIELDAARRAFETTREAYWASRNDPALEKAFNEARRKLHDLERAGRERREWGR